MSGSREGDVVNLVESLIDAEGRADDWEELLDAALSPSFRIRRSDPTRPTTGKAQMIEDVRHGPAMVRRIEPRPTRVQVGEHLAIAVVVVRVSGETVETSWFENTLAFERHDDAWICTRWQSTRVPTPPSDMFCGDNEDDVAAMQRMFGSASGWRGSRVFFPSGIRTKWHTHEGRQVLFITGGVGWLQHDGDHEPVSLQLGVCETIEGGVPHWHGASADSWLEHVVITSGETQLCEDRTHPAL